MPGLETRRYLRELIEELAQREGTPAFEPHMTVIHRIEGREGPLCDRITDLAGHLSPIALALAPPRTESHYFRSLYLPVHPNPGVGRIRQLASRAFDHTPPEDEVFQPHFSLLYGDIPEESKQRLIAAVGDRLPQQVFCDQVALYRLSGSPDVWSVVRLIPL